MIHEPRSRIGKIFHEKWVSPLQQMGDTLFLIYLVIFLSVHFAQFIFQ